MNVYVVPWCYKGLLRTVAVQASICCNITNVYLRTIPFIVRWVNWCGNSAKIKITLIQKHLPKLHENIMNFCILNLFKEIAISFNYDLQTTSESSTSFSNNFLIQVGKCFHYSCFLFIFCVAGSFLMSNSTALMVIKGIALWGLRRPDIKGECIWRNFLTAKT